MAVQITKECISCEACAPECPVAAILEDGNDKNPKDGIFYVKPESCVECVDHADAPRCAEACPTVGAIVWDMPYTIDFNTYYSTRNSDGIYKIREHKSKGLMLPEVKSQKFKPEITMADREAHSNVSDF
ncbi:4Fe-4S dicluster domain-containing protein [Arcobacter sp. s6]|uniref:4Fe-4S dicluster domain-containing protein n=1 Tax=Arcobacter sp. s6 TaxID=3230363 RepID=UPI00349FF688